INVAAVTGRPAFTKSLIVTETPSRDATCTTITLHAAPRIVALPAKVELAASASQSWVEPCGTTSARGKTAGTLLIRVESRDGRARPRRWTGAIGAATSPAIGAARSLRNASRTPAMAIARQTIVTGRR